MTAGEIPAVTKIREEMKSHDLATRTAAYAAYGMYLDAVRKQHVCALCGWHTTYHDDGDCPTAEQQAALRAKGVTS